MDDSINVLVEAHRVMQGLQLATFESFREVMHSCPDRNVFMAYLTGYYNEDEICVHPQELCEMMKMGQRLIDYELLYIKTIIRNLI